jgi:hypothetical protein
LIVLSVVGTRFNANYRVKEQSGEQAKWYAAKITQVNQSKGGTFTYNVEYDDGDFEDDVTLTLAMFGHLPRPPKR